VNPELRSARKAETQKETAGAACREPRYGRRNGAAHFRFSVPFLYSLFFLCAPLFCSDNENGWIDFPSGFGLAGGRIRIELEGTPLPLWFSAEPSWSDDDEYKHYDDDDRDYKVYKVEAAPDVYLRFLKPSSGEGVSGFVSVLSLRGPDEALLEATVEATLGGLLSPALVRCKPSGSGDVVFLSVDGSGAQVASGLYEPARDRSVDFSQVYKGLRLSHQVAAPGSQRVRFQGTLPRGREVFLFWWEVQDSVFHRADAGGPAASRSAADAAVVTLPAGELVARRAWLTGWSVPGGSAVEQHARKILAQSPMPAGGYFELSDGWQGDKKGAFRELNRSWLPQPTREEKPEETSKEKSEDGSNSQASTSQSPEIARQLDKLGDLGFVPALWIVPHGQSDGEVFRLHPEAFVRSKTGNPISGRFLGRYVVDGSSPAGLAYLKDLFGQWRQHGCANFRVAGLRQALEFYDRESPKLTRPDAKPIDVVAATLRAMRAGAGEDALLAGDWDTPPELASFLDATRPTLHPGDGVEPLGREGLAAQRGYFRHRGACWVECFPVLGWAESDFEHKRDALDRSRILFAALTGRGLVIDERAWPIPAKARTFLRQAWPPAPVRPMDLFPPEGLPRIWDLKISDPSAPSPGRRQPISGTGSDLVGLFNWDTLSSTTVTVSPHDLGLRLKAGEQNLFFDVLEETFVGVGAGARDFLLLPGRARLLSIQRDLSRPQVIAVTGKWLASAVSLAALSWDERRLVLAGTVLFPAGADDADELRLHIALGPLYRAAHAEAQGRSVRYRFTGGHLVLPVSSAGEKRVPFRVRFSREASSSSSPAEGLELPGGLAPPANVRVSFEQSERRPLIEWAGGSGRLGWFRRAGSFVVRRNGMDIGQTKDVAFLDRTAPRGTALEYTVVALDRAAAPALVDPDDAPRGAESLAVSFRFPAAADAFLDDWTVTVDLPPEGGDAPLHCQPAMRRSLRGLPLSVGGKKFDRGIGTRAPSRLDYRLDGKYEFFEAEVGVDDAALFQGSVVFVVRVDGVERYRSPTVRGSAADPLAVRVPVAERQVLSLVVEGAGAGAGDAAETDLAIWGGARVLVGEAESKSQ